MSVEFSPETTVQPTEAYLDLPQQFGSVDSAVLGLLAEECLSATEESPSERMRIHGRLIAASALVEATLVSPHTTPERIEFDLIAIDRAEEYVTDAVVLFEELLASGREESSAPIDYLRAKIQLAFMNVYRYMAEGRPVDAALQRSVIEQSSNFRTDIARYRRYLPKNDYRQGRLSGLDGEVLVLLDHWKSYQDKTDSVAFPSTIRGGTTRHTRKNTHDIVLAKWVGTDTERIGWTFESQEVKTGKGYSIGQLSKYGGSSLAIVAGETIRTA